MFELFIPGKPLPKERPRAAKNGRIYTPKKTKDEEERIRQAWLDAGGPKLDGYLAIELDYAVDGVIITVDEAYRDGKLSIHGDIDNYVKLTLDGLHGAAFDNDKNVVRLNAVKE